MLVSMSDYPISLVAATNTKTRHKHCWGLYRVHFVFVFRNAAQAYSSTTTFVNEQQPPHSSRQQRVGAAESVEYCSSVLLDLHFSILLDFDVNIL